MAKDLRSFINLLEKFHPDDVLRIKREVDPLFELTAITVQLEREGLLPLIIFERVKGHKFPVANNVLADHKKIALALNTSEADLIEEYARRETKSIAPRLVKDGPVKEVKMTGREVDLNMLPIVTHNEKDDAPYITMGLSVCKDPDSGARNIGIYRHRLIDKDKIGLYYSWGKHIQYIHRKAEQSGKALEVAIAIGLHPAFYVASQTMRPSPLNEDEFGVVGGLLGEPFDLVKCETVDLEVPADAEFLIEGELLPNVREKEGPFGEFTGCYGQTVERPVMKVKAITHRKDAIYQDCAAGYVEHREICIPCREGFLLRTLRGVVPTVKKVAIPSTAAIYTAYISMEKVNEGDAKNVLLTALGVDPCLSLAIAVDEDINVYNESEVMWAVSTRVQGDRDIFMVPGARANRLDPASYDITRLKRDGMVTKIGIDATIPLGIMYEYPEKVHNPLVERINYRDYI